MSPFYNVMEKLFSCGMHSTSKSIAEKYASFSHMSSHAGRCHSGL